MGSIKNRLCSFLSVWAFLNFDPFVYGFGFLSQRVRTAFKGNSERALTTCILLKRTKIKQKWVPMDFLGIEGEPFCLLGASQGTVARVPPCETCAGSLLGRKAESPDRRAVQSTRLLPSMQGEFNLRGVLKMCSKQKKDARSSLEVLIHLLTVSRNCLLLSI